MTDKFISLKEAGEISGYAPDYIGQLIRKGKLPGKQVYHSVAWVTTESAVRDYIADGSIAKEGHSSFYDRFTEALQRAANEIRTDLGMARFLRFWLYAFAGVLAVFIIILFYIVSIRIDGVIQERALREAEEDALIFTSP